MTSFQKAIEIDLMRFNKDMTLMEDADYIAFIEGDYYEESGDSKENIFEKAIRHVRDLIRKIKDKIAEKFSDAKVKKQQEKLKMEVLSDPNKKNKKVKVRVNDKVYALDKKALDDLTKCKTKEEVEKYMADYKKKREKLVAGSIVLVSAATAIGILGSKLHRSNKQLDELEKKYTDSVTFLNREKNVNKSLKRTLSDTNRKLNESEALSNQRADKIKDMKKQRKIDADTIRDHADYMKTMADATRGYASSEVNSVMYNTAIKYHSGDMDKASDDVKRGLHEMILGCMNDIINESVKMEAYADYLEASSK